jgi:hypothetical protein
MTPRSRYSRKQIPVSHRGRGVRREGLILLAERVPDRQKSVLIGRFLFWQCLSARTKGDFLCVLCGLERSGREIALAVRSDPICRQLRTYLPKINPSPLGVLVYLPVCDDSQIVSNVPIMLPWGGFPRPSFHSSTFLER